MTEKRSDVQDFLLAIACGVVLALVVRAGFSILLPSLSIERALDGGNPLQRIAVMRLVVFALLVLVAGLLCAWPLARYARNADPVVVMPGASCAAVLYVLIETAVAFDPFPTWYIVVRATLVFLALPAAFMFWRRR